MNAVFEMAGILVLGLLVRLLFFVEFFAFRAVPNVARAGALRESEALHRRRRGFTAIDEQALANGWLTPTTKGPAPRLSIRFSPRRPFQEEVP